MMQFDKCIFLTGFMGCGKSTIGKKLAKLLNYNFIDLDSYIEQKEKLTIDSIFTNFGEETFRKIEQTSLNEIILNKNNTVIALGGGTICYSNNLKKIKDKGLLIFINLPATALVKRLEKSKNKRPLLKNYTEQALTKFIIDKLNERLVFYSDSHITVSGLNLTPQILQKKISDYNSSFN